MTNTPVPDDQKTCLVVALKGSELRRLDLMLPPGKTRDDFILDIIRRGAPPDRSTRKTLHDMELRMRDLEKAEQQLFSITMRHSKDIGALGGATSHLPSIRKRLDANEALASDARSVARGASMLVIIVIIACVVGVAFRAFWGV